MIRTVRMLAMGAAAVASLVSGAARAEWLEATTQHFVIVGNLSPAELRRRALRLEQFDAAMRYLVGGEEGSKLKLYLVESMSEIQRLAGDSSVAGFYSANSQGAKAFMPMKIMNQTAFTAEVVLLHEYTHHMLLASTTSFIPRWATEGLAEMFSTARFGDDGSVTIGAASVREYEVKALRRWTVEEMLRKDVIKVPDEEVIERYSRGWSLCHYLWMSGKRPGQYVDFIRKLNETGDQIGAGQSAFGDLRKLDSEVDAYVRRSAFPASRLGADQIKASEQVAIRSLTGGETAMIVDRMASERGVDKAQAIALFTKARGTAARFPDDARVQGWFAEIAFDAQQFDEADKAADRALAVDPNNLAGFVYKGRVAARKAYDTKAADDWKSARAWFLKANKADPNDPYPFVLYYDSFGVAGQRPTANAVNGLYRAVMLMPQDMSLRRRAGYELLQSGNIKQARLIVSPAAFNPHGKQDNPATKLVAAIDAGLGQTELLAKAQDLGVVPNSLVPPKEGGANKDEAGDTN